MSIVSGTERLRIAFVADTINGPTGGGVLSAHRVVEKLRALGHEMLIVSADAEGPGRLEGFSFPIRAQKEMGFVMAQPERKKLEQLFATVDVVHLQFPFLLSLSALKVARDMGRPVVAAFHVQPENVLLNVGIHAHWPNEWLYNFWVRRLYNQVDAVIVPTAFAERKLRAHGLVTPATVVSNGVPPDVVETQVEREQDHHGFFLVLAVGRLAAEKRQADLIEAIGRSRYAESIKLILAGSGPLEEALQKQGDKLPHRPKVGFLERDRLVRLFNSADLLVHCSEVELEGIAVLEAISVGLPALIAQGPESAASELALDYDFRFKVGDTAELAEKLSALVERPQVLARARFAYREAARVFDFDENVEKLVGVYRDVLNKVVVPAREGGAEASRPV